MPITETSFNCFETRTSDAKKIKRRQKDPRNSKSPQNHLDSPPTSQPWWGEGGTLQDGASAWRSVSTNMWHKLWYACSTAGRSCVRSVQKSQGGRSLTTCFSVRTRTIWAAPRSLCPFFTSPPPSGLGWTLILWCRQFCCISGNSKKVGALLKKITNESPHWIKFHWLNKQIQKSVLKNWDNKLWRNAEWPFL